MPAVEIRAQTFEKKSRLPAASCTRKCLPCSTQNFEVLGDESIAIVLNGHISTGKMEETTGKFETVKMGRCSQNGFEGQNKEAENKETKVQEGCDKTEKSEKSSAKTSADGACVPPSSSSGLTIKGNRAIALRDLRVSTSSLESDEELITDIMQSLTVNVAFSPKSPASFFNVSTN